MNETLFEKCKNYGSVYGPAAINLRRHRFATCYKAGICGKTTHLLLQVTSI